MNTQFRREIKLLLQAGLLTFSFTVVVGILNGLDAPTYSACGRTRDGVGVVTACGFSFTVFPLHFQKELSSHAVHPDHLAFGSHCQPARSGWAAP